MNILCPLEYDEWTINDMQANQSFKVGIKAMLKQLELQHNIFSSVYNKISNRNNKKRVDVLKVP